MKASLSLPCPEEGGSRISHRSVYYVCDNCVLTNSNLPSAGPCISRGSCPLRPDAQTLGQCAAESGGRRRYRDSGSFHCSDFRFGIALAAGDDCAGVAHASPWRRRAAGNETHHRFLAAAPRFVGEKLRGILFRRSADLADHDDRLGRLVGQEHLQNLNEFGALHRIAADAHGSGLTETGARGWIDRLIGKGAGARHDSDLAGRENISRHNADLAFPRRHHAWAVRADETRRRSGQGALDTYHVQHRDPLGDADNERNLRLNRFANGVCSPSRRHIDHTGIAIRLRLRLGNRIEDRQPEMRDTALSRRSPANHLRAVSDGLIGMERTVLAGEALTNHSGVLVDEDGHPLSPPAWLRRFVGWAKSRAPRAAIALGVQAILPTRRPGRM